ncbi:hypothetical protein HDV03_002166 [Kappamyces sp. JEL0829]|nr:hypothetical protein HDV03_002166 [Kappamyces sp. JEL0829]
MAATSSRNQSLKPAPPPLVSLGAGMIAGAIEGVVTYPTEFVKTQLQIPNNTFQGPLDCIKRTVAERGILGLYKGLSPLVIGNASKAGVRFLTFDQCRDFFLNTMGMPKSSGLVVAGLAAGMVEGLLVVTPSGRSTAIHALETIKTKMIHDQNKPNPRFKGLFHGVKTIVHEEGVRGIYRGVGAVIARQGANSAVRMSSYGLIREQLAKAYPLDAKGKPLVPWYISFLSGTAARG